MMNKKETFNVENDKCSESQPKGSKAKWVGDWARATENVAKALVAVVGLVVLILVEALKRRSN